MKLLQQKYTAIIFFHVCNGIHDSQIIAGGKEDFIQVALDQIAAQALIRFYLFNEMADSHLVLRVIAEDADVDLVAETLALQKVIVLNQRAHLVKALLNGTHGRARRLNAIADADNLQRLIAQTDFWGRRIGQLFQIIDPALNIILFNAA